VIDRLINSLSSVIIHLGDYVCPDVIFMGVSTLILVFFGTKLYAMASYHVPPSLNMSGMLKSYHIHRYNPVKQHKKWSSLCLIVFIANIS